MNSITLRRPDDWHVHLRDGDMMKAVLPYTAKQFGRAIRSEERRVGREGRPARAPAP